MYHSNMSLINDAAAYGLIKAAKKDNEITNAITIDHRPDRVANLINGLTLAGARLGLLGGGGYGLYKGIKAVPDLIVKGDGPLSNLGNILAGIAWRGGLGAGLGGLGGGGLGNLIGRAISPVIK